MSVRQFHPGNQTTIRRGQEICLLGLVDSYREIATVPLLDYRTRETIRNRIKQQRANMREWLDKDTWSVFTSQNPEMSKSTTGSSAQSFQYRDKVMRINHSNLD